MSASTMPVAERFVSVNGEGLHVGQSSTFIRFVGCNLACSYCDTKWACSASCSAEDMTIEDILAYVQSQKTPCVTLTGGEPCLQPLLPSLVALLASNTDAFIEIETNGAVNLTELAKLRVSLADRGARGRLGFTVDCKSPSSGMADKMLAENYALLGKGDCVKFVVGNKEDLQVAKQVILENHLFETCPVLFSPVAGQIEAAEIVAYLQEEGLREARVQVQLHKIIWPNESRGV